MLRLKPLTREYFSEKDMIKYVREYQLKKDGESFKKIKPSILKLINGMINKQFSYNYHIQNNRGDVEAECFIEILRALDRYDPEKGRLFAYLNRVAKNTMMKYYKHSRKIRDREKTYTDVVGNFDESNTSGDDAAMSSSMKWANLYVDDTYDLDTKLRLNPSCSSTTLRVDDTINIIYNYLCSVRDAVAYFVNNKNAVDDLIKDINLSTDIDFNFTNSYSGVILSEKMFYTMLINRLYEFINTVVLYIESRYRDYIRKDDSSVAYDGRWSRRAVGYVRKIVKTKLKNDSLTRYYKADDLVNFIKYLVKKRYGYGE